MRTTQGQVALTLAGTDMQSLLRDVRYALRSLRKAPGLTAVAVLALTLGIGLTTTMFSIVYGALLKGLPYPDGDRVVAVNRSNPARGINNSGISALDFVDYRAQQRSFSDLAAVTSGTIFVSGDEKAERFDGSWITANALSMLAVKPVIGRHFRPGEDTPQGEKVAILSYSMWHDRYASDAKIVGRVIRVNGVPTTVVGVMPEHFEFPENDQIWLPLQTDPNATDRAHSPQYQIIGKLKPGASLDQANVELATIAKRLATAYPDADEGFTVTAQNFADNYVGKEPRQLLYTMLTAVFFVLLIACANVANLLLDRAAHRTKEVGVRTALGASRGAVVRQFLAESLVLSIAATALGIGLAHFGLDAFTRVIAATTQIPPYMDFELHPQVLLFTICVAALTTLAAGAIPAIQSSRADINEILKDETRGASSFRIGRISKGLVIFEIALSCGLLVAAGLMVKSVAILRNMDPGFTTKDVFTARVGFPAAYTDTIAQWRFFDEALQKVSAIPGVVSASVSSGLPATRQGFGGNTFGVEGQSYLKDKDYPNARWLSVTPDFFNTLKSPVLEGRAFTISDRPGELPVAIVNREFVSKFYKGVSPIGKRIRLGASSSKQPWLTIVGVVGNQFTGDNERPIVPAIYQPFAQSRQNFAWISARTSVPPASIAASVRRAVASVNADIPLYWVDSLDNQIARQVWFVRVFGTMFMIFGFVALFLASVGLYAVMAFSVSRRIREVGIRMALGARAADVVRMIFRQGFVQLAIGMAIGLLFAVGIGQTLKAILFQVQPRDPQIFVGVAVVLTVVGLVACLVPARRATRVDPLVALRSE